MIPFILDITVGECAYNENLDADVSEVSWSLTRTETMPTLNDLKVRFGYVQAMTLRTTFRYP